MKKYILLFNIDKEYGCDTQMVNKIKKAVPEAMIIKEQVFDQRVYYSGESIWIPEEKYLIALTIADYEELLGITFYDDGENEPLGSDYLLDWYKKNKNNDLCVRWVD